MIDAWLGLVIPVAVGVFIVFNLTCMRNPVMMYNAAAYGAAMNMGVNMG